MSSFSRHKNGRDGLRHRCRECCNATERERRAADPERFRAIAREYARTHREENIVRARAWYQRNREVVLPQYRAYYRSHREQSKVYAARARDKNREANRQRWREISYRRRLTPEGVLYSRMLLADPCSYCGEPASSVDHIDPVARDGSGEATNLTAACRSCNSSKQDKPLLAFLLNR